MNCKNFSRTVKSATDNQTFSRRTAEIQAHCVSKVHNMKNWPRKSYFSPQNKSIILPTFDVS